MRRHYPFRLDPLIKRMTSPFRHLVAILMYHRVYEAASDPWDLCVSPSRFAEHLDVLRSSYQVMRLGDLVTALKEGTLSKRGVVITFDDGYVDNLWNAKPLLESFRMPATVFVASGSLDSPTEFWWDNLERALLQPRKLPSSLKLRVQDRSYEWATTDSHERLRAYMAVHGVLKSMRAAEREQVMDAIFDWAGIDRTGRSDCRPMTAAELIELGQSGLIDIGAHTVTHPILPALPEAEQHAEIAGSRKELERILGRRVDTFSYPSGKLNRATVSIVADAGFTAGLLAHGEAVGSGADLFRLGRLSVGDWAAKEFEQRLDAFFRT